VTGPGAATGLRGQPGEGGGASPTGRGHGGEESADEASGEPDFVSHGDGDAHRVAEANRLVSRTIGSADPSLVREVADSLLDTASEAQVALVMGRDGDQGIVVVKARKGGAVSAKEVFDRLVAVGGGRGGGSPALASGGGFAASAWGAMVRAAAEAVAGEPG
jgi:alanyl-tRNA synthetase